MLGVEGEKIEMFWGGQKGVVSEKALGSDGEEIKNLEIFVTVYIE